MKQGAGIIFRTLILILLGIGIGIFISDDNFSGHGLPFSMAGNDKISRAIKLIKNKYVDSVDVDSMEGVTVNNLLQNLDPHSLYLPPQRAQSINESLDGGFNGIGLEYQILRDTLFLTQVYPGGPAFAAGIKSGDRVIEVDRKKFSGTHLTVDRVNKTFRGEKGTDVLLGIAAAGKKTIITHVIKRSYVDLSSLDAAYMVAPVTGYIKISKFASTTDADFRIALRRLKQSGMKKLVLDLRENGGGCLNAATALADEFLPEGRLIVYTKGIHEERRDYFATDSGEYQDGKLAVLIDEYSASASEILAGALQDLDRALIVGRRSFGKGLVQQQFPFGDGSAINLTVARYYTPSGRSIQKSYKYGTSQYHNEIAQRMRKGELFSAQSNMDDSLFKGPTSYRTIKGRKVFSGGGIMPDIFVPADTAENTLLIRDLSSQQLFNAYILDRMQPTLNKFSTAEAFIRHYNITDNELNDFIVYASKTIKEMDSGELRQSAKAIKTMLKGFAARFKWGDNAYFEAMNADDATLKKAIKAMN